MKQGSRLEILPGDELLSSFEKEQGRASQGIQAPLLRVIISICIGGVTLRHPTILVFLPDSPKGLLPVIGSALYYCQKIN